MSVSDLVRVATTWYLLNVEPWVAIPGIDGDFKVTEWRKPDFVLDAQEQAQAKTKPS